MVCRCTSLRHAQHDFLGHRLDARRQIHVALFDHAPPGARGGPPKSWSKPLVGHRQPLAIVEILHVHPEAAVGPQVDQVLANQVGVDGLAVGRQAHQLVFAAVDLEPAIIGERRVKQAERVGKRQLRATAAIRLPSPTPMVAVLHSPTPSTVRMAARSNGLGKNALAAWLSWWSVKTNWRGGRAVSSRCSKPAHVHLVLQPDRHRLPETPETRGREREIGFQQPVKLGQRLVVKGDVVQFRRLERRPPAGNTRRRWSGNAGSCFLRVNRSSCAAATMSPIHDQRRRAVVVKGRDAENACHVRESERQRNYLSRRPPLN